MFGNGGGFAQGGQLVPFFNGKSGVSQPFGSRRTNFGGQRNNGGGGRQNNGGGGGIGQIAELAEVMMYREQRAIIAEEQAAQKAKEEAERKMREDSAAEIRKEREEWQKRSEEMHKKQMDQMEAQAKRQDELFARQMAQYQDQDLNLGTPRQRRTLGGQPGPQSGFKRARAAPAAQPQVEMWDDPEANAGDDADWEAQFRIAAKKAPRPQRVAAPFNVQKWCRWKSTEDTTQELLDALDVVYDQPEELYDLSVLELSQKLEEEWEKEELKRMYSKAVGKEALARWTRKDILAALITSVCGSH